MSAAKYIVWDDGFMQCVVFSETLAHADVARALNMRNILGAGFAGVDRGSYYCFGKSVSLRKESRGEDDEKVLNKQLGGSEE